MYAFRQAVTYLLHALKSIRLHGIHSPFVFNLYNQVICHQGTYYAFAEIENLRRQLYATRKRIAVTDFGAGSRAIKTNPTTNIKRISQIARVAANPPPVAQLLFRLVNFQQPATILEMGTSLGLSTAYLAAAKKQARVFTLEGCPLTAQLAQTNFKNLKLKNIQVISGNFDDTLPAVLKEVETLDFVFFDGNHRYEPTMRYFTWCLAKRTENSVFVLDDIYWSAEMAQAWQEICAHPEVMISIDLFQVGLVFFRKNQPKQHFTIKV